MKQNCITLLHDDSFSSAEHKEFWQNCDLFHDEGWAVLSSQGTLDSMNRRQRKQSLFLIRPFPLQSYALSAVCRFDFFLANIDWSGVTKSDILLMEVSPIRRSPFCQLCWPQSRYRHNWRCRNLVPWKKLLLLWQRRWPAFFSPLCGLCEAGWYLS